jgi:hypothetical protein
MILKIYKQKTIENSYYALANDVFTHHISIFFLPKYKKTSFDEALNKYKNFLHEKKCNLNNYGAFCGDFCDKIECKNINIEYIIKELIR